MGSSGLDLLPGLIGLLLVAVVITLVAWALNLMQSASDSNEFSLMLAGVWCVQRPWVFPL